MSLEIRVYCKEVSADLIPKIVKRLNDFDMMVEIHPNFMFDQEKDAGFLPFKFRLKEPYLDALKDKDLISGFEIYIGDFDLQKAKEELRPKPKEVLKPQPSSSFFGKLLSFFGKPPVGKQPDVEFAGWETDIEFASPEIEERLKDCKKEIVFVGHASDLFEFRFHTMTSAILAEITDGVYFDAEGGTWADDNKDLVEDAFNEAKRFEQEPWCLKHFKFHEFDESEW